MTATLRFGAMLLGMALALPAYGQSKGNTYRFEKFNYGSARTQRRLLFYSELPNDPREAERLRLHELPCGTPLTPIAYQVAKGGDRKNAYLSFHALHANGHILVDEGSEQDINLLDYFLFDPEGTPYCHSAIQQTLSQCGSIGVRLTYTPDSVLQAEIENLTSSQVLFLDWKNTRLDWAGGQSLALLPSDLLIRLLEIGLQGKAESALDDVHPTSSLVLPRWVFRHFAANRTVEDLTALRELSRRVHVDPDEILPEPLGPGQKRRVSLSARTGEKWTTTGLFLPSTRGTRYTLSIPIARQELIGSEIHKPVGSLRFPRGNLVDGAVEFNESPRLSAEPCEIGFMIP